MKSLFLEARDKKELRGMAKALGITSYEKLSLKKLRDTLSILPYKKLINALNEFQS